MNHQDPYDAGAVLELERQVGYQEIKPLILRTPPWSLFLVLPLGFLTAFWAWVAWIALLLIALVGTIRLCWKMYGSETRPPDVFLLVAYLFAPVPACLVAGQIGLVLAVGLALFLWLEPKHPSLAGTALVLPFAKPHLLALFWIVLAIWVVAKRRWAVFGGLSVALAASTCVALIFDPAIFRDYRAMIHHAAIGYEFIPAISGVVRLIFFRRFFWVQFIPLAVALIWAAWFYKRYHSHWQWKSHGLALLAVSVLVTPYAWLTDEVVLLPVVLQGAIWAYEARASLSWKAKLSIIAFACLNILLLLILWAKVPFTTGIYFWSSLVWFVWYLCTRRFSTVRAA